MPFLVYADPDTLFFSLAMEIEGDGEQLPVPAGAKITESGGTDLPEIDFDDGMSALCPRF